MANDKQVVASQLPPRLEQAVKHVSDLWFPADEALLARIREGLRTGHYDDSFRTLLIDVSSDFSLFTYTLRELSRYVRVALPEGAEMHTIYDLFERAGLEGLRTVLDVDHEEISTHKFSSATGDQRQRIHETLVSATTSRLLAQSFEIDLDLAYSSAVLRQLGLSLIAWNYPSTYQRAAGRVSADKDLDSLLASQLGFSPALLAAAVIKDWALPRSVLETVAGDELELEMAESQTSASEELIELLTRICRIGETLARAQNPSLYPRVRDDWEWARREISEHLGSKGLEVIRDAVQTAAHGYVEHMPHIFEEGFFTFSSATAEAVPVVPPVERNPLLKRVRPFMFKKLELVYNGEAAGKPVTELLQLLMHEVVPAAGFIAGCVYTADPTRLVLQPQLRVRGADRTFTQIEYSHSAAPKPDDEIVLSGFRSNTPVVRAAGMPGAPAGVIGMAGHLGRAERVGVLYLEIREVLYFNDEQYHQVHFAALAETLNDILKVH